MEITENGRTQLLVYGKWVNPYTQKEEELSIWMPMECIDNNLSKYFEQAYNIEIKSLSDFYRFLDALNLEVKDLEAFPDLVEMCLQDYYKTKYYEEDKADALDEYEMMHDLGDYQEEDDYVG